MKSIFFTDHIGNLQRVFSPAQIETIRREFGCDGVFYQPEDLPKLSDTEYIFSTWGMPTLCESQIRTYLPKLKCIFYAAGTVKKFAEPFLTAA